MYMPYYTTYKPLPPAAIVASNVGLTVVREPVCPLTDFMISGSANSGIRDIVPEEEGVPSSPLSHQHRLNQRGDKHLLPAIGPM